jgi:ectoine hydroxylase-related dioxygenase (phytanoyl-CoA dioxygenase family)
MKLTPEQVAAFREQGYLVAEGVVTEEDLAPFIGEYEAWIDARARALQAEGKITNLYENEPWEKRFARLYEQAPEIGSGMDVMHLRGPATFGFFRNDNLLDAVESIIGPEITCSPIQHIRAKVPNVASKSGFYNVPWHQDMAVTWEEADDSDIITCWMALADATVENGCMEVLPGVWKKGLLPHYNGEGGTSIRPEALPPEVAPVPVPVRKGGVVFMHRCTPHRSTPNLTDGVRWSLDLRYQPTGTPTGRPFHPEFVARSRAHPESVLTDHAAWDSRWAEALVSSKGIHAHRVK